MANHKPQTLIEVQRASVARWGDRPLFGRKRGGEWVWTTYADHASEANRVRGALTELGVEAGDRVALISDNRPEWASVAYAAFGLGAAVVPMYESQNPREWRYILRDCDAKVLFVANDRIAAEIEGARQELPELRHVLGFDAARWAKVLAAPERPERDVDPTSVAAVMYTSGTTGLPKGVRLSHRNLTSNVLAVRDIFPLGPEDRTLSFLPWAHAFGQTTELHTMLSLGGSIALAQSVETILSDLLEVQPTILVSVPRIFHRIYAGVNHKVAEGPAWKQRLFEHALHVEERRRTLAEHDGKSVVADAEHRIFDRLVFKAIRARFGGRLRYAFSGGAPLSKEVAAFVDDLGVPVYEGYGLTETSPVVAANRPGARKIGSVGRPIPGVRVEIDRMNGDGPDGEIVVHGPNVMLGYHQRPEETARAITAEGGLRTGDLGHVDDDGYLWITGRIKELYKLENGKYVAPAPLEEKLKLSPFIANALVYGDGRPFNVALIVANVAAIAERAGVPSPSPADVASLLAREDVRANLAREITERSQDFKPYEKILRFAVVAEDFNVADGTMTPTLKTKRAAVIARHRDRIEALYK